MPQAENVIKSLKKWTAGMSTSTEYPIMLAILRALKWVWQTEPNQSEAIILWVVVLFGVPPLRGGSVAI